MGRRNRENRRGLEYFKKEQGYLLMSTLFFLIFSGLFSHSVIKISANQIIQLRQFASAYEAKGALNMSEELLNKYINKNKEYSTHGKIRTSIGNIEIRKKSGAFYGLNITLKNGVTFSREAKVLINSPDESAEETKEKSNKIKDDIPEAEDESSIEDKSQK